MTPDDDLIKVKKKQKKQVISMGITCIRLGGLSASSVLS